MLDIDLHDVLPHRYPFLFIDGVESIEVGASIVALRMVSASDPILQGHFPGNPIVPGVVQVEAMAQAALILSHASGHFSADSHHGYFMGISEAKFRAPVRPGDVMRIEVEAQRMGRIGRFRGRVVCGGDLRSSAAFTAICEPKTAG